MNIKTNYITMIVCLFSLPCFGQLSATDYQTKLKTLPPQAAIDSAAVMISQLRNSLPAEGIQIGNHFLALADSINYEKGSANLLDEIGVLFRKLGHFYTAYSYHLSALEIYRSTNDKRGESFALTNIGIILNKFEDYSTALSIFKQSLDIKRELLDEQQICYTLNYMGQAYAGQGELDSARRSFNESIVIAEKLRNRDLLAKGYRSLGEFESQIKNYEAGSIYILAAYEFFVETNNAYEIAATSTFLVKLFLEMRETERASEFAAIAEEYSRRSNAIYEQYLLQKILYEHYSAINDEKKSMDHLVQLYNILNTINSFENEFELRQIKDLTELKSESRVLKSKYEVERVRIEFQRNLIYLLAALILVTFLFLVIYIKRNREKRKLNSLLSAKSEELAELNNKLTKEILSKDQIVAIIAHDLKNPFNHLINASSLLNEDFESLSDDEKKELISGMKQVSDRAYLILKNLLQWALVQTENLQLKYVPINVYELVEDVLILQRLNSLLKNLHFKNIVDKNVKVFADRIAVDTVLRNLLNNASKFSKTDGEIIIESKKIEDEIVVCITDFGIGIPEEMIPVLFETGTGKTREGTAREKGTGLGLILCKDLIEKNGGKIWVESVVGEKSVFYFSLPSVENN